jgi:5-formyltetrahydrofolate cyclo-ligase
MDKDQLRRKYRKARISADVTSVDAKSLEICRKVFKIIDWETVNKVCSYQPIGDLREVDVSPLHDVVKYKFPQIKIKLLKPDKNQTLLKISFDVIIVPCLAFDKDNHRLGWGGGFYDRFLAGQRQALKIGVAYHDSLVKDGLPREPHDIALDMVITER